MQNLKINISPTDRPQWHTPAEIRAAGDICGRWEIKLQPSF